MYGSHIAGDGDLRGCHFPWFYGQAAPAVAGLREGEFERFPRGVKKIIWVQSCARPRANLTALRCDHSRNPRSTRSGPSVLQDNKVLGANRRAGAEARHAAWRATLLRHDQAPGQDGPHPEAAHCFDSGCYDAADEGGAAGVEGGVAFLFCGVLQQCGAGERAGEGA